MVREVRINLGRLLILLLLLRILPAFLSPLFQARIDVGPKVLEFIGALSPDDIVTELVQNDLDQGARSSRIVFNREMRLLTIIGMPAEELHVWYPWIMRNGPTRLTAQRTFDMMLAAP